MILMALFALTLVTYFVIRPTVAAILPSKPSPATKMTPRSRPIPTVHKTSVANPRPRTTSTYNGPISERQSSPTGMPAPTLTIAPVPTLTIEPPGVPAPTDVPPTTDQGPPVDSPPSAPAPGAGSPATGAP